MRRIATPAAILLLIASLQTSTTAAEGHAPGVLHSSLLNAVKLDFDSHEFYLDRFTAVFLPNPEKKTSSMWPYNPDDGEALVGTVTDAKGKVVLRYGFYASMQRAPFWVVHNYKILENKTGNAPSGKRVKLAPGSYALDLTAKGKKFYHFPFEVSEVASDDAFTPEPYRFLEGGWQDWAYVFYPQANPEMSIYLKVWLRLKGRTKHKKTHPQMEVFRGDKRVAVSPENMHFTLRPEWNRFDLQMRTPPDAAPNTGKYLKAKDILDQDGAYRIELALDGKPYGTWRFEVKDGKLVPKGRTLRGTADPLTFVEGGRDAFWYERDK
ncbi:MAG: hypothetical protein QNJ98_17820 [Planctomycetota bacterium]|nr:hypothetical protein [Planctomycetota bacterium]